MKLGIKAGNSGSAYTVCLLGDPIGCAGVYMHEDGMGEIWSLFSPILKTMPLSFFRTASKYLEKIIKDLKPVKIFAVMDESNETSIRFIEHLKFPRKSRKLMYERTP